MPWLYVDLNVRPPLSMSGGPRRDGNLLLNVRVSDSTPDEMRLDAVAEATQIAVSQYRVEVLGVNEVTKETP